MKLKEMKKRIVYSLTTKPQCYVHVDEPKNLQDLRQIQYNNWCKAKGVYNGSYLPMNPDMLKETSKKGWKEITSSLDKTKLHRSFQRKSNGQIVDYHYKKLTKKGTIEDEHYHWWNVFSVKEKRNISNGYVYKNRYGRPCLENSQESHLAPLDGDYNFK